MSTNNIILDTDSYKFSHWKQYPPKTEIVFSYIEARGGQFDKVISFGTQVYLKEVLSKPITQEMIDEADAFVTAHVGPGIFNREGWQYILDVHGGYLPVKITAVPEGTPVAPGNVLVTIENTDPKCFWLPSYLETALLRAFWYPSTAASNSYAMKQIIKRYLEMTGDPSLLPFKLHDFGARGVSSEETAGLGGMAHLVNFMGSDTVSGVRYAQKYYNTKEMIAFSIPAAEHSTMTSWGGRDGEVLAMENMIDQFLKPGSIVACVSDSYNIFNAIIQHWGTTLHDKIVKSGGVLVIRPDSGDPVEVTLQCVKLLGEKFGSSINQKGYKVLHPSVRLIQGDGIDLEMVEKILANFAKHGWSADNIAFGSGGGLLQKLNRDTCKFAMKCSAIRIDGKWIDVFKQPITDAGKNSKKGRLMLFSDKQGDYFTDRETSDIGAVFEPALICVFENGKIIKEYTFAEVRNNSERG